MKKIYVLGILLVGLVILGAGCSVTTNADNNDSVRTFNLGYNNSQKVDKIVDGNNVCYVYSSPGGYGSYGGISCVEVSK